MGAMRRAGFVFAGLAVALAAARAVVACSIVTSYDGFTGSEPAPCGRSIPTRPSGGTGGGGGTYVGFLKTIRYFDEPDATPLGYNLDALCTCPDRGSCKLAPGAPQACDVPAGTGIDNAAGVRIGQLFGNVDAATFGGDLGSGPHVFAMRLENYNGQADDAEVTVSLYNALAVGGEGGVVRYDGNDPIVVDHASLFEDIGFGSKFVDTTAYVRGGVLVAALAAFSLEMRIPVLLDASGNAPLTTVEIPLSAAHVVGRIQTTTAGGLTMNDAQLVGRLKDGDVLTQVGNLGICQNDPEYPAIKQALCSVVDMPADPAADGTQADCDALSFAVGMTITPGKLASVATFDGGAGPCGFQPAASCK